MTFTEEQQDYLIRLLEACSDRAYRDAGYKLITFSDGSIGVLKASSKLIGTVQALRDHFAVAIGAAKYADETTKPIVVTAPTGAKAGKAP